MEEDERRRRTSSSFPVDSQVPLNGHPTRTHPFTALSRSSSSLPLPG